MSPIKQFDAETASNLLSSRIARITYVWKCAGLAAFWMGLVAILVVTFYIGISDGILALFTSASAKLILGWGLAAALFFGMCVLCAMTEQVDDLLKQKRWAEDFKNSKLG